MDYLITGGAGFIGSHLADALLARDDTVLALDDLSTAPSPPGPIAGFSRRLSRRAARAADRWLRALIPQMGDTRRTRERLTPGRQPL